VLSFLKFKEVYKLISQYRNTGFFGSIISVFRYWIFHGNTGIGNPSYMYKYPSTNNALESCNNEIKRSKTLRERYPLSRFRIVAQNIVGDWSKERDTTRINSNKFSIILTITTKMWTDGYQWMKLNKKVLVQEKLHHLEFYFTSSTEKHDIRFWSLCWYS